MTEKNIENKIKKALNDLNLYYFKVHGGAFMRKGIPDLIVNYKGLFMAIEVKMRPNKLTKLQEINLDTLRCRKCELAFVIDDLNVDEFVELLKNNNFEKLKVFAKKTLIKYIDSRRIPCQY